jgi:hypothetical protein
LIGGASPPTSLEEAAMDLQRFLIGLGLVILIAGIAWRLLSRIGFGRLPGDIVIKRGTGFYFPVVTGIVISIALSAIFGWSIADVGRDG